jgi:hypothetical protein
MPIQSIVRLYDASDPPVEIGIRFNGVGKDGFVEGFYADIGGNRNNPNWWAKMTVRVQDAMDVRIKLNDASLVDDPAGPNGEDPARPDFFWDGTPPSGDLVSRSIIISNVSWDDDRVPPLHFKLMRARR